MLLVITLLEVHLISQTNEPNLLVGVDIGFGDEDEVYKIANAVAEYANLIILGSLDVTNDTMKLIRVCDVLYERGFFFIVYVGFRPMLFPPAGPNSTFVDLAEARWGNKFLGLYIFDEPGGKQLDYPITSGDKIVSRANSISDAAIHYVITVEGFVMLYQDIYYKATENRLFTSDYGLYWFDYLSGYDVVLGEFTGNHSRPLALSMTRGAARCLDKDWGVMITWKYMQPPYVEEPDQLYEDMVLAYQYGAKYIVVFNSPGNFSATTSFGILTQEHLDTMKKFWDYTKSNPRNGEFQVKTAYVLPRDYGFGFRGPNDNIWGLWPADALSEKVWNDTEMLLRLNGKDLDIVYETKLGEVPITLPYNELVFWNSTKVAR